jgi:hypothetical protein
LILACRKAAFPTHLFVLANDGVETERCVTVIANNHKKAGLITGTQKEAIVLCAHNSSLP